MMIKHLIVLFFVVFSVYGYISRENKSYDDSNRLLVNLILKLNSNIISGFSTEKNLRVHRVKRPSWNFARKVFFRKIGNGTLV